MNLPAKTKEKIFLTPIFMLQDGPFIGLMMPFICFKNALLKKIPIFMATEVLTKTYYYEKFITRNYFNVCIIGIDDDRTQRTDHFMC